MKLRKLLSMLLAVAMILGTMGISALAVEPVADETELTEAYADEELVMLMGNSAAVLNGEGTVDNPYTINSVEEFKLFRDDVNSGNTYENSYIELTTDIDLGDAAWTPIGDSTHKFCGYFDGNGKKISNLKVSGTNNYAGLFGYILGKGMDDRTVPSVKNLIIDGADISGSYYVGALTGQGYICAFANVTVKNANVSGERYVGGIAGHVYTYFKDCYYQGEVSGTFDAVGGMAGAGDGRFYDCAVIGNVTGSNWVGGIIANGQEGTSAVRCYVKGNVKTNKNYYYGVGGIAGVAGHGYAGSKFENNYFDGKVFIGETKINAPVMGFVNANSNDDMEGSYTGNSWNTAYYPADLKPVITSNVTNTMTIEEYYASSDIRDERNNKIIVNESDLTYVTDTNNVVIMEKYTDIKIDQVNNAVVFNNNEAFEDENVNGVYDSGETAYATLAEALNAAGSAGAGNTTIGLFKDIDLEGTNWTPVNVDGYNGADIVTLNGNGKTITGINAPLFYGGFAGGSGIIINDLTIEDSEIVSTNDTGSGAFIEYVDSMDVITLKNCALINSTVTGSRTGGLVGYTTGYNNTNDGPVKTKVTIENCKVIGNTITGSSVGAVIGHAGANAWTYNAIKNCTIEDNTLISTDDGGWRVGVVVGTSNIGELELEDITYSGNTLTQGDKTATDGQTDLIGRSVPGETGKVWIDEVPYGSNLMPAPVRLETSAATQGFATLEEALAYAKAKSITEPVINLFTNVNLTPKLAGFTKVTLNGTGAETVVFPKGGEYYAIGSALEFNNLAIERDNSAYAGIAHNGTQVYNNCVINGVFFINSSESVTFNSCEFNVEGDAYNVWTYGAEEVVFNNCAFYSDGKSMLVYREGGNTAYKVAVNDCEFYAADSFDGKAAIEIDASLCAYDVEISNSSAIGFDEGSISGDMLWNIKNTNYNEQLTKLTVNDEAVDLVDYKANTTNKDEIAVKFVKADIDAAGNDTDEAADIYNIVLSSDNKINRLNSADLTFKFSPVAVSDGNMKFEIIDIANDNIHVAPVNNSKERFEFHFDGKDGVLNDTATDIVIAQVKFTGYGTYSFNVTAAATNAVHATTLANNLVDTYVSEGAVDGEGVLDIENGLAGIVKKVPTRNLTVEITFPNAIEYDNTVAYQDMKVTIVGGNQNIEIDLAAEADYTFTKALPYETAYTVTISGAGYRTATYTVQLTEDKTLNFWNNVMDRELEVEVKNSTSKTVKNFLAGDIVGDDEINIYDLSAAVSYFGTNTKGDAKYSKYDLNRDGKIDSKDVAFILVSWGE